MSIIKCGMKQLIHSQTSNSCTVEVWECISNFIPHFIMDMITYPCWDSNYYHISQGPGSYQFWLLLCLQICCYRMLVVNMPKQSQNQTRISPIQVNYAMFIELDVAIELVWNSLWTIKLKLSLLEVITSQMTLKLYIRVIPCEMHVLLTHWSRVTHMCW